MSSLEKRNATEGGLFSRDKMSYERGVGLDSFELCLLAFEQVCLSVFVLSGTLFCTAGYADMAAKKGPPPDKFSINGKYSLPLMFKPCVAQAGAEHKEGGGAGSVSVALEFAARSARVGEGLESEPQRELAETALVVVAASSAISEATLLLDNLNRTPALNCIVIFSVHVIIMMVEEIETFGAKLQAEALR